MLVYQITIDIPRMKSQVNAMDALALVLYFGLETKACRHKTQLGVVGAREEHCLKYGAVAHPWFFQS